MKVQVFTQQRSSPAAKVVHGPAASPWLARPRRRPCPHTATPPDAVPRHEAPGWPCPASHDGSVQVTSVGDNGCCCYVPHTLTQWWGKESGAATSTPSTPTPASATCCAPVRDHVCSPWLPPRPTHRLLSLPVVQRRQVEQRPCQPLLGAVLAKLAVAPVAGAGRAAVWRCAAQATSMHPGGRLMLAVGWIPTVCVRMHIDVQPWQVHTPHADVTASTTCTRQQQKRT
jgi:hypothetical protein